MKFRNQNEIWNSPPFCGAVLFSEAVLPDTDQDDLYLEIYC